MQEKNFVTLNLKANTIGRIERESQLVANKSLSRYGKASIKSSLIHKEKPAFELRGTIDGKQMENNTLGFARVNANETGGVLMKPVLSRKKAGSSLG